MRGHVIGRLRESFYNEVRRKVNFPALGRVFTAGKHLKLNHSTSTTSQVGKADLVPAQG